MTSLSSSEETEHEQAVISLALLLSGFYQPGMAAKDILEFVTSNCFDKETIIKAIIVWVIASHEFLEGVKMDEKADLLTREEALNMMAEILANGVMNHFHLGITPEEMLDFTLTFTTDVILVNKVAEVVYKRLEVKLDEVTNFLEGVSK